MLPPQGQPFLVDAVGAVVVDAQGRFVLIRRARPPLQGVWTLPGGRVEPGESFEAAVVRELREETSLETAVVELLDVVIVSGEGFAYRIHEHLATIVGASALNAGDDAAEARWTTLDELPALGVTAAVASVVAQGVAAAARHFSPAQKP